ncbi:hypothetical protein ACQEU5_07175 [Marinactinospora thermotolerans]|uniref:hypothetical protein n=1 Tax=Marinactinospora thermotolerans TaxID=531310 RepID=UPI003D9104E6
MDYCTADYYRCQTTAVTALADWLAAGAAQGCPPMDWTMTTTGVLVARSLAPTAAQQRTAWAAWTDFLGATPWPESARADGMVHLHAVARNPRGTELMVALVADLFPDQDV